MTGTSMPSRGLNAGLARTPPARLEHSKNLQERTQ